MTVSLTRARAASPEGRQPDRRRRLGPKRALLVAGVLGLAALFGATSKPPRPGQEGPVRLVLAGDIMLDWFPEEAIARGQDPFAHFADVLAAADVRVGNLECVVATVG